MDSSFKRKLIIFLKNLSCCKNGNTVTFVEELNNAEFPESDPYESDEIENWNYSKAIICEEVTDEETLDENYITPVSPFMMLTPPRSPREAPGQISFSAPQSYDHLSEAMLYDPTENDFRKYRRVFSEPNGSLPLPLLNKTVNLE